MIDIESLDENLTYAGYQVGDAPVSKIIQKLSKNETNLPVNKIASHVFALVYQENQWFAYEAHMKYNGCKKLPYSEWKKDYKPEAVFCCPRDLYVGALEFYANPKFNPGYSAAQIFGLAMEEVTEHYFWNDNPGMICSEYVAIADKGFKICYEYGLKANRIKPVHWQMELMKGVSNVQPKKRTTRAKN